MALVDTFAMSLFFLIKIHRGNFKLSREKLFYDDSKEGGEGNHPFVC